MACQLTKKDLIQLGPIRIQTSLYMLISSGNSFKKWKHQKWEYPSLSEGVELLSYLIQLPN